MARQKVVVVSDVTRQQAEEAFATYCQKVSTLQIIEGEMNGEITAIKDRYESRIGTAQEVRDQAFEVLQVFATENPGLFDKKKSVEWTHGVFGFRTGTPKLKTRKGFTWASVLTIVKSLYPKYVRTVEELNKELIIADREALADGHKDLGIEIVQDETFFVQPNLQNISTE